MTAAPSIVIFGNCQGVSLYETLKAEQRREIIPSSISIHLLRQTTMNLLNKSSVMQSGEAELDLSLIDRCSVLIFQVNEYHSFKDILDRLPPQAKLIRFPYLHTFSIWPTYMPSVKGDAFGYGDRLAKKMMIKHLEPMAALSAFLNTRLLDHVNVDRLHAMEIAAFEKMDRISDIPIAEFFKKNFKTRRLFWAPNHPSNYFIEHAYSPITEKLSEYGRRHRVPLLLEKELLNYHQQPLNPQVIDHFQFTWVAKGQRYLVPDDLWLTFEEYMLRHLIILAQVGPEGLPPVQNQ